MKESDYMKQFVLGVVSGLSLVGIGKLIYNKGHRDGIAKCKEDIDIFNEGMKTIKNCKESE